MSGLKAPFPWFGGKSRVAHLIWPRFGGVSNYVEPFFGSGAVLLKRPDWEHGMTETVNDYDGFVCNFWRAVQRVPAEVARWADWPTNENDLHARNLYLAKLREQFRKRLEGDPNHFDPMIAGWWAWGMCCWIGGEFATLNGPWISTEGQFEKLSGGVKRCLISLGGDRGVQRSFDSFGVSRKRPELLSSKGVQKRLPHLSSIGQGAQKLENLTRWFEDLGYRLGRVRVSCGNWDRILGESVTTKHGITGVFLDPPYDLDGRDERCYTYDGVWSDVVEWCLANGDNSGLRIALCGYDGPDGERLRAAGWIEIEWTAPGGYARGKNSRGLENRKRERIWFSPACVEPAEQMKLFETEVGV